MLMHANFLKQDHIIAHMDLWIGLEEEVGEGPSPCM